jgi:hypothetical protein
MEENIVLMPYFWKMSILNGFRPCYLAARQIAQNFGYLQCAGQARDRPEPAMAEIKPGFPERKNAIFSRRKKR